MAIPKLALIPSGVKAGKLYSVLPTNGDGDFTTTRNTVATRVNENGLIEEVAANVPRLDYSDGGCPSLLLEPASTNLITYSEAFDNAYWSESGSSVVSGFASPKGDASAFKLVEDTSTGEHVIFKSSIGFSVGSILSYSFFVKENGRDKIQFYNFVAGGYQNGADFDLSTGVVSNEISGSGSMVQLDNGWWRCNFTSIALVGQTGTNVALRTLDNSSSNSYTGDGTSGVYIYGAQLEQNSYATSYIKTVGTTQTRSADTANGAGNASTFNDSEGVLMAEISALANDGTNRRISISNGSTSDRIVLGYTSSSNQLIVLVSSNSVSGVASIVNIDNSLQFNKIALKYKLNDFALWINGIEVLTDNSLNSPIGLNDLSFEGADNLNDFYGNTKQIQYFDSALNDSELEKLTSWTSFNFYNYKGIKCYGCK